MHGKGWKGKWKPRYLGMGFGVYFLLLSLWLNPVSKSWKIRRPKVRILDDVETTVYPIYHNNYCSVRGGS